MHRKELQKQMQNLRQKRVIKAKKAEAVKVERLGNGVIKVSNKDNSPVVLSPKPLPSNSVLKKTTAKSKSLNVKAAKRGCGSCRRSRG